MKGEYVMTTLLRITRLGIAGLTLAGSVALVGTTALAASSRDCKLYGHCRPTHDFVNSYNGDEPQAIRRGRPAPGFQIHEETGIVGPHGHNWESTGKSYEYGN